MKKLLLLSALLIFACSGELYSQDEQFNNSVNINIYNKIISTGTSQFTISVTKGNTITFPISFKKLEEMGLKKIKEYCKINSYDYKIINLNREKRTIPSNARIYGLNSAATIGVLYGDPKLTKLAAVTSIMSSQKQKIVTILFNVSSKDGSFTMSKEQARVELINLKELYDMNIITKSEFDKRAKPLKKIVLKTGN